MNLAAVMDELGAALGGIEGLRVFSWWADRVTPPAALVEFPESLDFDATFGRGSDTVTVPVVVLVGRVAARSSRDDLAAYCDGSGPRSVKAAVESHPATAYDSARVASADFGVVTVAGTDYLAATFSINITGSGA